MNCPAEMGKSVNCSLSIAVKQLQFGEIGGYEYRTVVSLGSIEDHVQSFGLFSIVIHHWLDTDLVYDRIVGTQKPVQISFCYDAVRENPAEVLCVYRSYGAVVHPEQHREDIVQDQTFATTAVSYEHQPLVVGVYHPIHELLIFRKPHESVDGVIHLREYASEESLAFLLVLAPAPAPFLSRSDVLLLDHQLDQLFDCLCFHVIGCFLVYHFLHFVVSQSSFVV